MLFLLLVALLTLAWHLWNWRDFFNKGLKLPGPRPIPILGNLLDFYFTQSHVLEVMMRRVQEYKGFAAMWQGHNLVVLISKPEYLREFYTNPSLTHRSMQYDTLKPLVGLQTVLSSSGDVWKANRKMLKLSFSVTPIEDFFENFKMAAKFCMRELQELADGSVVKSWLPLRITMTHALLSNVLGGSEPEALLADMIVQNIEMAQRVAFMRQFSAWQRYDLTFQLSPTYWQYRGSLRRIDSWVHSLASRSHSEYLSKESNDQCQKKISTEIGRKEKNEPIPNLWVYNMLEKFPERTLDLLADDLKTLILAGLDTTSGAVGYALIMLGLYPHIQARLHAEAVQNKALIGDREITLQDLDLYEYTDRFLREVLRLFPIGEIAGRKIVQDTYFGRNGEHLVPKGADVIVMPLVTHRDPEVWPDPLTFDPDRFLPENFQKVPPFGYVPFGHGRRNCPGYRYAVTAMKLIVPCIVADLEIGTSYKSMEEVLSNAVADGTLNDRLWFPCSFTKRPNSADAFFPVR